MKMKKEKKRSLPMYDWNQCQLIREAEKRIEK